MLNHMVVISLNLFAYIETGWTPRVSQWQIENLDSFPELVVGKFEILDSQES